LNIKEIEKKEKKLEQTKLFLKNKFVGLDEVIDSVISSIKVWYIMPELLTRPAIINLWGLTGVGKTDLVRTLVEQLNFNDKFVEIQLKNSAISYNSIRSDLESSSIDFNTQGILLLDEIQRFRSINENGEENSFEAYDDIWTLLSDGKFNSDFGRKKRILRWILEAEYRKERQDNKNKKCLHEDEDEEDVEADSYDDCDNEIIKDKKYKLSYWAASEIKTLLNNGTTVGELMRKSHEEIFILLSETSDNNSLYSNKIYSKLLIFISGNLDEAFIMANETTSTDIDADIFHKHSKKINILNIKRALNKRFRAEQISRFGNIHIIYPSLSKENYKNLIKKKIDELIKNIKTKHNISIYIDESINDMIYRNGVFPAQGVRPVFSSISLILESTLPDFMLEATKQKRNELYLSSSKDYIKSTINGKEIRINVTTQIDKIKKKINKDVELRTLIHEAAHALVFSVLFKKTPMQVVINEADGGGGFVGGNEIHFTKTSLLNKVRVQLAGIAAEKMIYKEHSVGCSEDLVSATILLSEYIRRYSMDKFKGVYLNPSHGVRNNTTPFLSDEDEMNTIIKKLLDDLEEDALSILKLNEKYYKALIVDLKKKKTLNAKQIKSIASKHGLELELISSEDLIVESLEEKYNNYMKDE